MAINQPHEGGITMLSNVFGSGTKDTSFKVLVYLEALPTDDDDLGLPQLLSTYGTGVVTVTNETVANAALEAKIGTVAMVPQVEFPEYKAAFTGTLSGNEQIFGYAIVGAVSNKMYYREPFTSAFTPAASKVLRFVSTLKLGNTTEALT